MDIRHIAVIGAGTMGSGIAQVCATYGYTVTLIDVIPEQLERAQTSIRQSVEKLHAKGRITDAQRDAALSGIRTSCRWRTPPMPTWSWRQWWSGWRSSRRFSANWTA